ncbi:MAG: Tudor-knot domain-containing protein [bacterium]
MNATPSSRKTLRILFSLCAFLLFGSTAKTSHAALCSAGDSASVKWKGRWYPATVTQADGSRCYIHYDGYDNSWDEWVGPGRIRVIRAGSLPPNTLQVGVPAYAIGDPVMVLWKGKWYPASVVRTQSNRWYIHYDGYGNNWDEWVGPARIKRK